MKRDELVVGEAYAVGSRPDEVKAGGTAEQVYLVYVPFKNEVLIPGLHERGATRFEPGEVVVAAPSLRRWVEREAAGGIHGRFEAVPDNEVEWQVSVRRTQQLVMPWSSWLIVSARRRGIAVETQARLEAEARQNMARAIVIREVLDSAGILAWVKERVGTRPEAAKATILPGTGEVVFHDPDLVLKLAYVFSQDGHHAMPYTGVLERFHVRMAAKASS